jgi:hypothetical protein
VRRLVRFCALTLVCGLLPAASAQADAVTLRIEGMNGPIFERASVGLPTAPVAPAGAPANQTCAGTTVIGAVHAAVSGSWSGDWSDTTGWSLKQIQSLIASPTAAPRQAKWVTFINGVLVNDPPCQKTLSGGDNLLVYPACLPTATSFSNCWREGPLDLRGPNNGVGGVGSPVKFTVFETTVTLDNQGIGSGQTSTSADATLSGPEGSAQTDSKYGTGEGALWFVNRGPAIVTANKDSHVPDRIGVCLSDGADGYCGTTKPDQTPFDPFSFCQQQTNGSDGYCGSPDKMAPLGRISKPVEAASFAKGAGPTKLNGTVDFDPTLTDHVDLRLMRQITANVIVRYKKKRVTVKKRVHGKIVKKRVTKKIPVKKKRAVCYSWVDATSTWKKLKKCDPTTATTFRAEGAEIWSYSFLSALPGGKYTFDAIAQDGAGNTDSTPEPGRNRVSFKVN